MILRPMALVLTYLSVAAASAQTDATGGPPPLAGSAQAMAAARQPIIDPVAEIRGAELVKELRKGGYVLYMRHATNGPGTVGNPCPGGDSPLTEEGRAQAMAIGKAIRDLEIRFGHVWTSQTCRAQMTGELVVGGVVEQLPDLNPVNPAEPRDWVALRHRLLNALPPAGTNTLLVSHFHGAPNPQDRLFLDMAEVIVFSPQASGRPLALARIPAALWVELLRANDPAQ